MLPARSGFGAEGQEDPRYLWSPRSLGAGAAVLRLCARGARGRLRGSPERVPAAGSGSTKTEKLTGSVQSKTEWREVVRGPWDAPVAEGRPPPPRRPLRPQAGRALGVARESAAPRPAGSLAPPPSLSEAL